MLACTLYADSALGAVASEGYGHILRSPATEHRAHTQVHGYMAVHVSSHMQTHVQTGRAVARTVHVYRVARYGTTVG